MRIIARLSKGETVRFISHLDLQRTVHRALRRANVPVAYSMGFNPHPQLAFAAALAVGVTSESEWFDVKLASPMTTTAFCDAMNAVLPVGLHVEEAREVSDGMSSLSALTATADYTVTVETDDASGLSEALDALLDGPVTVVKKTKSGFRPVDIRPSVLSAALTAREGGADIVLSGQLDSNGSLNPELLLKALFERWGRIPQYRVNRVRINYAEGVE